MRQYRLQKKVNFVAKVMMPGVLIFSLILMANFSVKAASNEVISIPADNANFVQGKELFAKGRKMFYNAEAKPDEAANALDTASASFNKLPDGYEKYYWLGRVAFVKAEMAEVYGQKVAAAKDFTESGNFIQKSLEYDANYSDSYRLLADTIMRLMSYQGKLYMMTQGPKIFALLNRALSLDEKNYAAMNSLGTYYINAPAFGGGSVAKGIQTLLQAIESKDEFDNFITFVWLETAYLKQKNPAEAEQYAKKALAIYPNSLWPKSLLK